MAGSNTREQMDKIDKCMKHALTITTRHLKAVVDIRLSHRFGVAPGGSVRVPCSIRRVSKHLNQSAVE